MISFLRVRGRIFILANILAMLTVLAAGTVITVVERRYFARDVLFVAPLLNESRLHFSADDLELLRFAFPDYAIVPESRGDIVITASVLQETATVIYTEGFYFGMHFMDFLEGGHWHSLENSNNVILNEILAWRLFGGNDVVGLPVGINGQPYIVAGVVRQGRARGDSESVAWMPRSAAPGMMPITALYIQAKHYNPLNAVMDAQAMIGSHMRRNPDEYAIVDINRFHALSWRNAALPPEGYLSFGMRRLSQLNRYGNYVWIAGAVALFNLMMGGVKWKK
jgi:hypothetical protein